MSRRVAFSLAVAASFIAVGVLTGCSSGGLPGGIPGASGTPVAGGGAGGDSNSTSGHGSAKGHGSSSCKASGTTIPAGKYSGDIESNLDTVMKLTIPGYGTVQNAGAGTTPMDGEIHLTSDGKTVDGVISLSGEGASEVGGTINSKTEGDLTGEITGPASDPIVDAKVGGAWKTLDAPINSEGSDSTYITLGLHITSVSCKAISGDAIAMFAEMAKPVAQYITVSGTGIWTAKRK
jgi:hypothetical protein